MKLLNLVSEIKHSRPDLTEREAIAQLNEKRALYLKNKLNQGWYPNDSVTQTLIGVETEIVDQSELIGFSTSDRILKTTTQVPNFVSTLYGPAILSIRSPRVLGESFNIMPAEKVIYAGNGKTNQRAVFCFPYNSYIYLKLKRENPKIALITTLSIQAIFENPLEAMKFNYPTLVGRDYWEQDYPLAAQDWVYVKGLILGNGEATQTQS